ncbi:MAG: hypothetical protein L6Q54_11740 [Leptospiraceae bacterium]|nr:hypothetical protein [Leptospiraceae bacterium]
MNWKSLFEKMEKLFCQESFKEYISFLIIFLVGCSVTKPIQRNNIEIVKDILEKKEITESDKKIIGKIIDSKIREDKEEKKYIKELEKENQKDEKKIETLSRKSGQVDLINKIIWISALCGIGLLLWKFLPAIIELIKKIPL